MLYGLYTHLSMFCELCVGCDVEFVGFKLLKAFSHLFFMLPDDDEESLRSTLLASVFAANNSFWKFKYGKFVRGVLCVVFINLTSLSATLKML